MSEKEMTAQGFWDYFEKKSKLMIGLIFLLAILMFFIAFIGFEDGNFANDCASFVLNKAYPGSSYESFTQNHPQFKKYHVNIDGWHYCIYPYEPKVYIMHQEDGQFLE